MTTLPYEFLVRFKDGVLAGAHVIFADVTNPAYPVLLPAQSIAIAEQEGFPLDQILETVQIGSLKKVESTQQECDALIAQNAETYSTNLTQLQASYEQTILELNQLHAAEINQLQLTHANQVLEFQILLRNSAEQLALARSAAETEIQQLNLTLEVQGKTHETNLQTLQDESAEQLALARSAAETEIQQLNLALEVQGKTHETNLQTLQDECAAEISRLILAHTTEMQTASTELSSAIATAETTISQLKVDHSKALQSAAEQLDQLQQSHAQAISQLQSDHLDDLNHAAYILEQAKLAHEAELEAIKNPPINWSAFRIGMMQDPAYDRVEAALIKTEDGTRKLIQLSTVVGQNPPNVPLLQAVFNSAIALVDATFTAAEIDGWKILAQKTNVPLTFRSNGQMELTTL